MAEQMYIADPKALQELEKRIRDEDAESAYMDWFLNRRGRWEDEAERITLLRSLNLQSCDIVLDAGCGPGRLTFDVAKCSKEVYAVDFSPKSVEVVKRTAMERHINNVSATVADLTQPLSFSDAFFDKVFSVEVIHHLPAPEWRAHAMKEFFRVLKSGGICSVMVFNHNIIGSSRKEGQWPNGLYIYYFDEDDLTKLFHQVGFQQVTIRGVANFRKMRRLGRWTAALDAFFSRYAFSIKYGKLLLGIGTKP